MTSIEIYTQKYCPYCHWAKDLLSRKGVEYREIDITGNAQMRHEMFERTNGRTSVPQIFIGITYVGGCDDLYALEDAGKLDPLLGPSESQQSESPPA